MPCDLVLLKSAALTPPAHTACYLETANLDGESNLKSRVVCVYVCVYVYVCVCAM